MGAELPLFTAFVARLPDPEIHLAAYGSLVFPIALVIEAPIIMLLAASTALAADRERYARLYRYMLAAGGALTLLHVAVAFTPLYELVAERLLHARPEVLEPGRIGLQIMTPWTLAIAHRRFQQGLLIRFGRSRTVGLGTLVRLAAVVAVLAAGTATHAWTGLPGIVVGATAIAAGVSAEALFVARRVRPLLREVVPARVEGLAPLDLGAFLRFYGPLAATPLLTLGVQPVAAAAMSNMPAALSSLAAWPGVHGLVFLFRSVGMAFNEVVVALLGEPGGARALRSFSLGLALATSGLLAAAAFLPAGPLDAAGGGALSLVWFARVSGLPPELAQLSSAAFRLAPLLPAIAVLQSWYTGALVHERRTRVVTEAVALYLAANVLFLGAGVLWAPWPGIHVALASFTGAGLVQVAWLAWRRRA